MSQVTRDAEFHKGLSYLRNEYSRITFKGRQTKRGIDVYVVEGKNSDDFREELFFDVHTGLLVSRYMELRTVLGPLPFQADHDDYREADGVKVPYILRWSLPGSSWTDTVTEIRHNVPIDDAKFVKPAPAQGRFN